MPAHILASSNPALPDEVPLEISLLLPGCQADDSLQFPFDDGRSYSMGIFLANPTLNIQSLSKSMIKNGVSWISNFPTVMQHDAAFRMSLEEVNLGPNLELSRIQELTDTGINVLACVCEPDDAYGAVAAGAKALLVLPTTRAFAHGFPSAAKRQQQLRDIRDSLSNPEMPLLGLITRSEADLPVTWPKYMDAAVVRP